MTDPKGKRMTTEELGEVWKRYSPTVCESHRVVDGKWVSNVEGNMLLDDANAVQAHIAALEAENKTLRDERDGYKERAEAAEAALALRKDGRL